MSSARRAVLLCVVLPAFVAVAAESLSESQLRSRAEEFYRLAVDRKFRQAEQLVAEESKDYFYEMKKPDLKSFRIDQIDIAADGKAAVVTVTNESDIFFPGAGTLRMPTKSTTHWKLENGEWFVFFDRRTIPTPLGPTSGASPSADTPQGPPGLLLQPGALQERAMALTRGIVQPDRDRIALDPQKPHPEVINLRNMLTGQATVRLPAEIPGLKIDLGKPALAAGESTSLTFTSIVGDFPRPDSVTFVVEPVNQRIVVYIDWAQTH
jgi:hypothetical protein